MRIACLFDGAGLARLGLEQAGHEVVGFEIDPMKHMLSVHVGSGQCILADATKVDLSGFDAVWASPPCQVRSRAHRFKRSGQSIAPQEEEYIGWCLQLPHEVLWVENVPLVGKEHRDKRFGTLYNAAQFLEVPIQNRVREVGGRYRPPHVFREYKRVFPGVCPTIVASEWKACKNGCHAKNPNHCCGRRAARFYGRRLTLEECAYHQGLPLDIVRKWQEIKPANVSNYKWTINLYEAIGNGVPVYMARAFGEAYC